MNSVLCASHSHKDSSFEGLWFYLLEDWLQLHLDFLAYLQMLQFLMLSNLAASQVLGSHPLSLHSLGTSLYCLLVSAGTEPSLDLSSPLLDDLLDCLRYL